MGAFVRLSPPTGTPALWRKAVNQRPPEAGVRQCRARDTVWFWFGRVRLTLLQSSVALNLRAWLLSALRFSLFAARTLQQGVPLPEYLLGLLNSNESRFVEEYSEEAAHLVRGLDDLRRRAMSDKEYVCAWSTSVSAAANAVHARYRF